MGKDEGLPGMKIGLSTHIFANRSLTPGLIERIARQGFQTIELYANRPHFDFTNPARVEEITHAIKGAELRVSSVHAPFYSHISDALRGRWLSICAVNEGERSEAVALITRALSICEKIEVRYLVVHFGNVNDGWDERMVAQGIKSLQELEESCRPLGVSIAVENIVNQLSLPHRLAALIKDSSLKGVGICLDIAHAHITGSLPEGIEQTASSILTTHLHDTRGDKDSHLLPFSGIIDWEGVMSKFRAIGYQGTHILEPRWSILAGRSLRRAYHAARKIENLLQVEG
ncbi:MAG: sugar phosphate isomerase/epimerase [Candidatus Aminicenantes bacterium]|nr:sugar phosphate isomerase/epimerase [Candidatus Aminicenantes bacterium]MDH5715947.1 sugar phosphate isomerase/epimerase [Candidatus Aminicenantes bacterium]